MTTISASFPNAETLRAWIADRYDGNPPELVWVGGIPSEEGGGVCYTYRDGSTVEAVHGRFLWNPPTEEQNPDGSWDPIR